MYLPFIIVVIASITVYLAWDTCNGSKEYTALSLVYLLVVAACVRYAQSANGSGTGSSSYSLAEAFQVDMPDVDDAIRESEDEKQERDSKKKSETVVDKLVKSTVKRGMHTLNNDRPQNNNTKSKSKDKHKPNKRTGEKFTNSANKRVAMDQIIFCEDQIDKYNLTDNAAKHCMTTCLQRQNGLSIAMKCDPNSNENNSPDSSTEQLTTSQMRAAARAATTLGMGGRQLNGGRNDATRFSAPNTSSQPNSVYNMDPSTISENPQDFGNIYSEDDMENNSYDQDKKDGNRHIQSVFNPQLVVNVPQGAVVTGNKANLDLKLNADLNGAALGLPPSEMLNGNNTQNNNADNYEPRGDGVNPDLLHLLTSSNDGLINSLLQPSSRRERYMQDIQHAYETSGRGISYPQPSVEGFNNQYTSPSPGFSRSCGGPKANMANPIQGQEPFVSYGSRNMEGFAKNNGGNVSKRRPIMANKEQFTITGRKRAAAIARDFCKSKADADFKRCIGRQDGVNKTTASDLEFCTKHADELGFTGRQKDAYIQACVIRQSTEYDFTKDGNNERRNNSNSAGKDYNSSYQDAMEQREFSPNELQGRTAGTTPRTSNHPPDAGSEWSRSVERHWIRRDAPDRPRFANWSTAYEDHAPGDPAPFPAGKLDPKTLTNRTYVPGMTYMPPSEWSVPQAHPTYCRQSCNGCPPSEFKLRGMAGRQSERDPEVGLFPLEIGADGTIAKTEGEVTTGNVGHLMPKFSYREYVDCPGTRPIRRQGGMDRANRDEHIDDEEVDDEE